MSKEELGDFDATKLSGVVEGSPASGIPNVGIRAVFKQKLS